MRRSPSSPSILRCCAVVLTFGAGLFLAAEASAAQPAAAPASPATVVAPAPAPATVVAPTPAPATATVVTPAPAAGTIIVAPAPAPVIVQAPAPAAPNTWVIQPIEPTPAPTPAPVVAPAPAPVVPSHMRVDLHPQPMSPPSQAELARLRLLSQQSRARSAAIAGWATLGGTYAFSALVGTIAMDTAHDRRGRLYGGWMTVPVGGPFIAAFYARSNTGRLLTASLGVAQATGLVIGVFGALRHRRLKRQVALAAMPMPEGGAVSMSMRF